MLLLWRGGDETAFAVIYNRYVLKLLAIAMDKTRDRDTAEELVQETFIAFHKSRQSARQINSVMAFLYVILKNKILDLHRQNLSALKYREYYMQHFTEADDATQALVDTRELEQLLDAEIAKLPAQCRRVFEMKRRDFMSNKEVAQALSISENTVEQHMRKALRLLKLSLSQYDLFLLSVIVSPLILK